MKKYILMLFLACGTLQSQTFLNINANHESIQIELEKSEESFYYKLQSEYNHNESYLNIGSGLGFNIKNRFETIRYYVGGKIGIIARQGQTVGGNATFGSETGIDLRLSDNTYLGAKYSLDWREDLKFFGVNYEASFVGNVFVTLKFKL